jgi:hypothetical protein
MSETHSQNAFGIFYINLNSLRENHTGTCVTVHRKKGNNLNWF